ncbi:MAG: hypothetical protein WAR57_10240 [Candidatus Phosphoribacter sp.]|nr:hypothetical protein [Actinomycetales bacterium]
MPISPTPPPTSVVVLPPPARSRGAEGDDIVQPIPEELADRVLVRFGDRILITDDSAPSPGSGEDTPKTRTPRTAGVAPSKVDKDVVASLTETERFGLDALSLRRTKKWADIKADRPRAGEPWDMASCDGLQPTLLRDVLDRELGIDPHDAGAGSARALDDDDESPEGISRETQMRGAPTEGLNDFFEGPVGLAVVFVQGPTAATQMSAAERTKISAEIQEGFVWLAAANRSAHLTFSVETHTVSLSVADATDLEEDTWRNAATTALGLGSGMTAVQSLAQGVRDRTRSRWGYVLFVTRYRLWHFAYASGNRIVMDPRNDGWGIDNFDRVFIHESGHIFGAPDEYASSGCSTGGSFGRFGEPNTNCANGNPSSVTCLMKANDWAFCASTIRHFGWGMDRMRMPSTASPIHIVSMAANSLTALGADELGDIRFSSWEPGGPAWWQGWTYLRGGRTAAGGHVTAVSRRPGYLDVFTVGLDGRVYTAAFDPSGRWGGWWAIGSLRAPVGAYVGAVSRSLDKLDIFVTDNSGRVMSAAWEPAFTDGWHGWWHINGGLAAPGAPVTGVSRSANKLDIFVVGRDCSVYTAAWTPTSGGWRGWWRIGALVATPTSLVSAVTRSADKLDIFVVDSARRTMTAAWEPAFTDGWHGWWHINGGLARPGTPMHAVSKAPNKLDVFVAGLDGGTYAASWTPTSGGWRGWSRVRGGITGVGGTIDAASRSGDQLDIITIGLDRRPYTAAHHPGAADWAGWWPMGS